MKTKEAISVGILGLGLAVFAACMLVLVVGGLTSQDHEIVVWFMTCISPVLIGAGGMSLALR